MGAVASVVTAVAVGVVGIVKAIQTASEDHEIRDNPVFEEITRRVERDEGSDDSYGDYPAEQDLTRESNLGTGQR